MKKRTAWILVAGVAAVAIGAAAVGALALMLRGAGGGESASWSSSSEGYLYLNLRDEIPEQSPSGELPSFFEKRPPSLRVLVESLDRAATDSKVTSVVLRVSFLPDVGWGRVQELRDAIVRFRKSASANKSAASGWNPAREADAAADRVLAPTIARGERC